METVVVYELLETTFICVATLVALQLVFWLFVYLQNHFHKRKSRANQNNYVDTLEPLSVIIYTRNQSNEIALNLPAILEQDYPNFEVIVVNDIKGDESEDCLKLLENKYNNLYHTFLPNSSRYVSRKKLAITLGVKASKNNWLVMTDVTCRPSSNQWLRLMARNFTPDTQIVLGYSGYERGKRWFDRIVDYDNLIMSLRYLGFALIHAPFMGIGRNMAYRKDLFENVDGFVSQLNIKQGEDDLFVNQTANGKNTRVETNNNAVVRKMPITYKKDWHDEKACYAATESRYKGTSKWFLRLLEISQPLMLLFAAMTITLSVLLSNVIILYSTILLLFLRYVVLCIVLNISAKDLNDKRRYWFSLPLIDFIMPLLTLRWKISNLFRNQRDFLWKA